MCQPFFKMKFRFKFACKYRTEGPAKGIIMCLQGASGHGGMNNERETGELTPYCNSQLLT